MVTLYTPEPLQIDMLQHLMDRNGVVYNIKESATVDTFLVVNGVPLDYERALKWIIEKEKESHIE